MCKMSSSATEENISVQVPADNKEIANYEHKRKHKHKHKKSIQN